MSDENKHTESTEKLFFAMSPKRLIILSLLTLGIYHIYWTYKNWKLISEQSEIKLSVLFRVWFYPLYNFQLFSRIAESAEKNGVTSLPNPQMLATVYLVLLIFERILGKVEGVPIADLLWFIVAEASVFALVPVQKAINANNEKMGHKEMQTSMNTPEILWTIFGVIIVLLSFLGIIATYIAA